jgi:hypothetical protein
LKTETHIYSVLYCIYSILGWVDIRIGTKGKWGFVVSLEKVWEIAIKVSLINQPASFDTHQAHIVRKNFFDPI